VVVASREEGEERGWAVWGLGIPPPAAPRRRGGGYGLGGVEKGLLFSTLAFLSAKCF
jgi:hypothetical protein